VLQFKRDGDDHGLAVIGEDLHTDRPEAAARWVRIYSELVGLHEDRLAEAARGQGVQIEAALDQLRARLDDWRQRHLMLAGMDFDPYGRFLTVAGHTIHLTRRETQLLDFLLDRPGQFFTSEVLIREAWEDPRLAPEQVRTYVVRLRRKLQESAAPARLVNKPRLGYALNVERAVPSRSPRRAS
jgi:DNA-binding winged helix-turn-helix (wHTH) protein